MKRATDDLARSRSKNVDATILEWKAFFSPYFRQRSHQLILRAFELLLTVHTCSNDACHRPAPFRDPETAPRFAQHLFHAGVEMAKVDETNQRCDCVIVVGKYHGIFCIEIQILVALESSSTSQNTGVVDKGTQRR